MDGAILIAVVLRSLNGMNRIVVRNTLNDIPKIRIILIGNAFLKSAVIDYNKAVKLAALHENICVYDTSSGEMFSFNSDNWTHKLKKTSHDDMLKEYGALSMDYIYEFVWLYFSH